MLVEQIRICFLTKTNYGQQENEKDKIVKRKHLPSKVHNLNWQQAHKALLLQLQSHYQAEILGEALH